MSDAAMPSLVDATIAVSIHGPAGVLDLLVPAGATAVDVAREYAQQASEIGEVVGIPLLHTALGERLNAALPLGDAGVQTGDVLVATTGVHRPRRVTLLETAKNAPETPAIASLIAAPAFAAAAAFAAVYEPGVHLLPAILGAAGISAAVVAGIARAVAVGGDEISTVWIVSGLAVFACCALPVLMRWDGRVAWALLVLGAMLAARFAPSLAVVAAGVFRRLWEITS